jgi:glucose dehydrogenase
MRGAPVESGPPFTQQSGNRSPSRVRRRAQKRGENAPFPTRPAPIDIQGLREEDLIDLTPELRKEALDIVARYDHGPLYTPPSQRGTIQVPGVAGAANWSGAAIDPETVAWRATEIASCR